MRASTAAVLHTPQVHALVAALGGPPVVAGMIEVEHSESSVKTWLEDT